MDMETFKMIHSELIMWMQYVEQDLRIIYATLMPGNYSDNYDVVGKASLGRLVKELQAMDEEVGYSKFKPADYETLKQIKDIRNYWCHQCFLDFHYIENPVEHERKFQELATRIHYDENRVYDLYQKIEKLRKGVVKKHKNGR